MGASESHWPRSVRERVIRGAKGQATGMVFRVLVQIAMAGVMLPAWGLHLYGEWLTIVGVALFLGASDFGFLSAASSDMVMSVGRGDREHAQNTFRTVGRGVGVLFITASVGVLALSTWAPLAGWLGLELISESAATAILVMIAVQSMLVMACMLISAGYASGGHYGDAFAVQSTVYLLEWVAAAIAALAGYSPLIATAALLATRVVGTAVMYLHMRRKVPWLSLGRPSAKVHVRQRLTKPALAGAAIGWGTALNMQALLVLVSVVAGAASAAVFATVRAVSRIVIQVASAIGPTVGSEVARAYSSGDQALLQALQRRVVQLGIWSALLMVGVLAFVGDWVVAFVTRGTVQVEGPVLLILLAGAVFEVAWLSAGSILFSTNRHQRVGLIYTVASAAILGVAYVLVKRWGIDGAAWSVFILSMLMLLVVARDSLRASGEKPGPLVLSLVDPRELRRAITSLRSRT